MTSRDPERCCEAVRLAILRTAWLLVLTFNCPTAVGAGLKMSDRPKPQHSSCSNIATHDVLPTDASSMLDDDVFNSPPSATARRRRLAAAVAATRAGASPSHAAGPAWMRPRLGSSVAGFASTSPPQISLRDIRKVN